MENFIEKLKTVDKKVWIGVGIGVAVVIIIIIALVIGLGKDKTTGGDTQNGTQYGTETEGGVTEVFGTEDVTEVLGTEIATETEMGTETEMSESESQSQTQNQGTVGNGETTVTQHQAVNGVEQLGTIEGSGALVSNDGVITERPQSDMTLTTVTIGPGNTQSYNIYNVGDMWFEITDSDMYVIDSNGTRHDSSFKIEHNDMPDAPISFKIGNKGSTAKSFVLKFANLKGSWNNPEHLSGNGPFSKHLNAGDEVGYCFKWTPSQTGTIRIYMSATADTEMNVQNTNTNVTIFEKFSDVVKTDEKGRQYMEFPVTAGEDIRIHVQAIKPTRGSIPATDITFEITY